MLVSDIFCGSFEDRTNFSEKNRDRDNRILGNLRIGISCHRNEKLKHLRHPRQNSELRIKNVA